MNSPQQHPSDAITKDAITSDTATADTIVACATPSGEGAVAVVRLSGPQAEEILVGLLGRQPRAASHQLRLGTLRDGHGQVLDRALYVLMRAPASYTGEHVVELHVHGSRVVVESVLARAQELGARLAEPGEFTLRAFLNGRMTLAQAEAVADLISASSDGQSRLATRHLQGEVSGKVGELLSALEGVLTDLRAALDFPEYPTGDGLEPKHLDTVDEVRRQVERMVEHARVDLHRRRRVVLCGAPNAGKSTLLNALAGSRRVLVHPQPGTTRDPVEVEIGRGTQRWTVVDTAGLRDESGGLEPGGLEAAGIALTREQMATADVVVWLVDPTAPVWPAEGEADVVVGSKSDLISMSQRRELERVAQERNTPIACWIAAEREQPVELRAKLEQRLDPPVPEGEVVVVRRRHVAALQSCAGALRRLQEAAAGGMTQDVLAMELEDACGALGGILGRDVDAEVLDRIFSEFCIGK